ATPPRSKKRKKSSRGSKTEAQVEPSAMQPVEASATLELPQNAVDDTTAEDLGLLLAAPVVEFDAAATAYDLELARERAAELFAQHAAEAPASSETKPKNKRD